MERKHFLQQVISNKFFAFGCFIALFALVVDQAHKWWMLYIYNITDKDIVTITPFFDLVLKWNKGISYGLFAQDSELGKFILIAIGLLFTAILLYWLLYANSKLFATGIGLVIGGAIGNIIDRFVYGAVADFFHFHAYGYSWYVFNIADIAICVGVALIVIDNLFLDREKYHNK